MKTCPHCHKELEDSNAFCPFCGEDLQKNKVNMDDILRCPYCHEIIHAEDEKCPHCRRKLKFLEKLYPNEKRGFLALILVGVGVAFCIIPFVSFVCLIFALVVSLVEKEKSRYSKDAIIFSIIGLVFSAMIFIINVIVVIKSQDTQTATALLSLLLK